MQCISVRDTSNAGSKTPAAEAFAKCQALVVTYDNDTGVLGLRLSDDTEYQIDNAGHARILRDKISPGGLISTKQYEWLERYRVPLAMRNRVRLRRLLKSLRQEIRDWRPR